MSQSYDWGTLYGQADMTAGQVIDAGNYDAVVESSEYGMTNDGSKGQWTVRFRVTTGPHAGVPLTTNMTISPVKNDGTSNAAGLGIMFRELGVLGIPVPPNQPFWALGWSNEQVAQAMIGKPALIRVVKDEEYNNNKIRGIKAARPGAPTEWQSAQAANAQQQAAAPAQPGYAPQQGYAPQAYGQPPQNGWQQPQEQYPPQGQGYAQPAYAPAGQPAAAAPGMPGGAPGYGQPPAPAPGQPSPWNQAPAGPTQPAYGGQPQNAGPGYASAPPANAGGQNPYPPQGQPPYGAPVQGAPAPGAQYPQGAPSPSYGQPPQGPAPYQGQPDQGGQQGPGPEVPPWAR